MPFFSRLGERFGHAVGATVGLSSSKGSIDRMNVAAQLRKEWGRYKGQTGVTNTYDAVNGFLTRFAVEFPGDVDGDLTLSADQLEKIFDAAAARMLASGTAFLMD